MPKTKCVQPRGIPIMRRFCQQTFDQDPMYHISTPSTSNLCPSSLSGSLPNVGHCSDTPFSRLPSTHSP